MAGPSDYFTPTLVASLSRKGIELTNQVLGEGSFSIVFLGYFCNDECAVKISLSPIGTGKAMTKELHRGRSLLWPLTKKSPFINTLLWNGEVQLKVRGPEHLCTVWEKASDSLADHCVKDEIELFDFIKQAYYGLRFLHRMNVVHRDVKPANILLFPTLDGRLEAQLGDFGLARFVANNPTVTKAGTPWFAHPEQLLGSAKFFHDEFSLTWVYIDLLYRLKTNGSGTRTFYPGEPKLTGDLIDKLFLPDSIADTFRSIAVLDRRDSKPSFSLLLDQISKHIVSQTQIGYGAGFDSKDVSGNAIGKQLNTVFHIQRSELERIAATSIGTDPTKLPAIVSRNLELVGAFRIKELSVELKEILEHAENATLDLIRALVTYNPDIDSVAASKRPFSDILSTHLQLEKMENQSKEYPKCYLAILNDASSGFRDAVAAWTKIRRPRKNDPKEKSLRYERRVPKYLEVAKLLRDRIAEMKPRINDLYRVLCSIMDASDSLT
ncbi:MAG: protein kinase [Planctomycetaceae bacterium]|nr:protein kinase [Planctomycetaceae bacterium]